MLPIVDYAASAWFGPGQRGTLRLCYALKKVQRTGARAILRAWITVALPILEAKAYIENTKARLTRKVTVYTVKILILPMDNPVYKAVVYVQGIRRYASPLSTIFAVVAGTIRNIVGRPLLENPPWVHAT
jgi:hypothetical protein